MLQIPVFLTASVVSLMMHRVALADEIHFKADYFVRDSAQEKVKAKGHAWFQNGDKQFWSDDLTIDYKRKWVNASGNVRILDGKMEIHCTEASYALSGEKGILKEATITRDQMVITGHEIEKFSPEEFEIRDGSYSNCNLDLLTGTEAATCSKNWRVWGNRFLIKQEGYVQFFGAVVFIQGVPVLYLPYFVIPAKHERQSGFLIPALISTADLGTGISLPYFVDLGPWQDLTLVPTYFLKRGYHLSTEYRYLYDASTQGRAKFSFIQRRFAPSLTDPAPEDASRPRLLGFMGEWAVDLQNRFAIGKRGSSRQTLRLVSDPYYTQDYSGDVGVSPFAAYLRSQMGVSFPGDDWLLTSYVRNHQSTILSKDSGVDGGNSIEAPTLIVAKKNNSLWGPLLSYEIHSAVSNFTRTLAFDSVPPAPASSGEQVDPDPTYGTGDYIREGRRFIFEPRLIANIPMPSGFQLQPVVWGGMALYHFSLPTSATVYREYLQTDVPLSLYFTGVHSGGFAGFSKVEHVIQPRVFYSWNPYQALSGIHPFFSESSNPRFDISDQYSQHQYVRFDFINRLRGKKDNQWQRFLLLQVSQLYNLQTFPTDPRYQRRLGPLEILGDLSFGALSLQVQASHDLETTAKSSGGEIRESNFSGALLYKIREQDFIRVTTLLRNRAKDELNEQSLFLDFSKTLPTFFDLTGGLEYSFKRAKLLSYSLGVIVAVKPQRCWWLSLTAGSDALGRGFTKFYFNFDFGRPG